jgi:tripeptide aminopeptidase
LTAVQKTSKSSVAERRNIELLMQLLALPGPSGGEGSVAEFLLEQLKVAGLPESTVATDRAYKKSPIGGSVGNLAVRLPGTIKAPRRLLMAHMDTVPLCAGARPVRKGRRIESRDAHTALGGDDRSGCAVLLSTALTILEKELPHPPLTFLWTVQEEAGLNGAHYVQLPMLKAPKLAFNWDGGPANRVTIGATGGYRMSIIVEGVASHAGVHPERGVSAVAIASLAVADLTKNGWHGLIEKDDKRGTSNVGVIHGGSATNVVTDRVEIKAEARSHDRKFRERIVHEIEQAFHRAAKEVRNVDGASGRVTIEGRLDYEAFNLGMKESSVQAAVTALAAEGLEPDYAIANGGLDANWLTAHGIPTVTLGCGQNEIHTVKEWLDLDQFAAACRIALRIATNQ